ncbi:MAG: 30S ribosomal protein S16 [Propionibacteriaceae bacterium]|nr:30S ribosomal protein S16 [Propionibacteriaceae bacterium]
MAVKIRLKRLGKIRSPHYRIVVMDARQKRDGRAIEEVGLYHPKNDPSVIQVNSERIQYWLGVGAQPTEAVVALLKRSGDWQAYTGDSTPSGIDPQKEKADKLAAYNAAVADEPAAGDAIKVKRPSKKEQAVDAIQDAITEASAKPTKAKEVAEEAADKAEVVADEAVAEAVETATEPEA